MSPYAALGWPLLLGHLSARARTPMGARAALTLPLAVSHGEVTAGYALVTEIATLSRLNESMPVGDITDIHGEVERAGKGATLTAPEVRAIGFGLESLDRLTRWIAARSHTAPRLATLAAPIVVDRDLLSMLLASFDPTGALSSVHYPVLGSLRGEIERLGGQIHATLDRLLHDEGVLARLQDRYVTERNGRFVLPVKASFRRGFGIAHGTSQTGETVFIEPAAVVELQNDLRGAEEALAREELRILTVLSASIGAEAPAILPAIGIATEIDLWCARERLGRDLDGTVPHVGTGGVLLVRQARHPLLALTSAVVPNDLSLTATAPALVLTGPNAGGKTVALKAVGLLALLVRACIPVPAAEGARVDYFDPILAEVGDRQSVEAGLSTFSGHLIALRDALASARPGALILIDEIAVGTDPSQGAALARAAVEALLTAGARVVVTTHYPELKLGEDPRFSIAAAQFEAGQPTFRLVTGAPGASMPIAVARRLGVPEGVLERAEALLEEGSRALAKRLERLDEEIGNARAERETWQGERETLAAHAEDLEVRERRLNDRTERAIAEEVERHRGRMRSREEEVVALIRSLQADPGIRRANEVLASIRAAEPPDEAPVVSAPVLALGDRVRVRALGRLGTVRALNRDKAEVEVGRMRTWVDVGGLERVSARAARKEERK